MIKGGSFLAATDRRDPGRGSWQGSRRGKRYAPIMKNFSRLVRFAWPYRVRFGLSIGSAMMVALLWFTELGAVYPLLQILFNSQNAQRWVVEQIDEREVEIEATEARLAEIAEVPRLAEDRQRGALEKHIARSTAISAERNLDFESRSGRSTRAASADRTRGSHRSNKRSSIACDAIIKIAEARQRDVPSVTSIESADLAAIAHRQEARAANLGGVEPGWNDFAGRSPGSTVTCPTKGSRRSCCCWSSS